MVERLKLITRQTPWSLLLKSGILALIWAVLPYPFFAAFAVVLYVLPFFRVGTFLFEFLLILAIAAVFPQGFTAAAIFWGLFLLLFGMKDLVIIDRSRGYEALAMLLALLGSIAFYASGTGSTWRGLTPFALAGLLGLLTSLILRKIPFEEGRADGGIAAALGGLLVWQLAFILLFLPFNFLTAAAVLFTFVAGFIACLSGWRRGLGGQSLITTSFALFAAIAFAALLLAPWRV